LAKDRLLKEVKKEQGVNAKGMKAAIQAVPQEIDLPIRETTQIVAEGWKGKPKDLLQLLWERGNVDEARL
jgi:hypothetical protein